MADIKAFKGYIYNKEKVEDISQVLAPPYDVISSEMQDDLYRKNEFNVVRLILGKEEKNDNGSKNRYKRAKAFFEDAVKKDILVRDERDSIYIYEQEYSIPGGKKKRIGFISLMKIEDPETSKVLPHERTFSNPKKDRLRLIKEVKANLSPIFSIFEDEDDAVTDILEKESKKPPIFDVLYDDIKQRLWRISDSKDIEKIRKAMNDKQIFIADGHHRYEVALNFRNKMRAKTKTNTNDALYNYVMMYFASLNETRLTILATHRAIKDIGGLSKDDILKYIGKHFKITKFANFDDMISKLEVSKKPFACGMYDGANYVLLELEDIAGVEQIIREKKPAEWKRLDVTILHRFILKRILKVKDNHDNITYLRDAGSAVDRVKNGDYKLAFFLNPTKLDQVKGIARMGEKMPHKSTYFYPKLLSGVVINKLEDK